MVASIIAGAWYISLSVVSLYVSIHSRLDVGASIGEFIARGRKAVIVSMHEISAVRAVLEVCDIAVFLAMGSGLILVIRTGFQHQDIFYAYAR